MLDGYGLIVDWGVQRFLIAEKNLKKIQAMEAFTDNKIYMILGQKEQYFMLQWLHVLLSVPVISFKIGKQGAQNMAF